MMSLTLVNLSAKRKNKPRMGVTGNTLLFSLMCLQLYKLKEKGYIVILYKYVGIFCIHCWHISSFPVCSVCCMLGVPVLASES